MEVSFAARFHSCAHAGFDADARRPARNSMLNLALVVPTACGSLSMVRRIFLAALFFFAAAAQCHALNLTVQLFPLTGEVRFRNTSGAAVPFAYYSITS